MADPNPYAPPRAAIEQRAGTGGLGTCPSCGSANLRKPSFTWWGGALGPKLLNHTICNACRFGFNAKTQKSNFSAIVIYQVVAALIAVAVVVLFRSMR